jgi:hypothetical protein
MDGRKGLARRSKRERRKVQKRQRRVHGQALGSLPSLRIGWDEGVHRDIIGHATGIRRWYNSLGLVQYLGERQEWESLRHLKAWRQGEDWEEVVSLVEALRAGVHRSLADECLRRGVHYGVTSAINVAERAIEFRVCSFTWKADRNGRKVFFPRTSPLTGIAYTEHFVERWMERVSGWDEQQRGYLGYWDLLGALHGPGRCYSMEDVDGDEGKVRIIARVLGERLPVGYAVVRDYQPTGMGRHSLMVTLLTETMVEAPWTAVYPVWEQLCHILPLPEVVGGRTGH